ncbi:MAG: DNA glycosylase AlkZ-like family protein [Acidimicrobiales bacterium]
MRISRRGPARRAARPARATLTWASGTAGLLLSGPGLFEPVPDRLGAGGGRRHARESLPGRLPGGADRAETPPSADEARVELSRQWLRAFGPATVADLKWWSGLTLGQVRTAIAALDVEEVDLDGVPGIVLADDVATTEPPDPWIALLPSLDPTTMGWHQRAWYLGDHARELFDTNGNAGPTVWSDGRIVGGWAQRKTGEVVFRLLDDVSQEVAAAVEAESARLTTWLGDVRVTPRFPTPLQRQLVA